MKVTGPWLESAGTQAVFEALTANGHLALAVGGCVRNALMGVPVTDIDIATDATPETVIKLTDAANLKSVPTGIDHGTITVVSQGVGYEITTFRADTETDGRRAIVRFSTDMAEDAARRDFTMNALYANAAGELLDPLGGLPDLHARRVRFIGDAHARIAEDYLRILRFFRFCAWYGDPHLGFDSEALAAIAESLDGLENLSRERVTAEVMKLLAAPDPARAIATMAQTGVLQVVLPAAQPEHLAPLIHLEAEVNLPPDALRRLASLGPFDPSHLRLPKRDQRRLELYQSLLSGVESPSELAYRHGEAAALDVLLLRAAMLEMPLAPDAIPEVRKGSQAAFPVKPADLMPAYRGSALGDQLRALEERWIVSGFQLSKSDLLD